MDDAAGWPTLPCPHCRHDVFAGGFFNHATETVALQEQHTFALVNGLVDVRSANRDRKTESHDCDSDAYCAQCGQVLPWSSGELKELDGGSRIETIEAVAYFTQQNYARR